jgi:hypothetical protein
MVGSGNGEGGGERCVLTAILRLLTDRDGRVVYAELVDTAGHRFGHVSTLPQLVPLLTDWARTHALGEPPGLPPTPEHSSGPAPQRME